MKVLVTGGSGVVGQSAVTALLKRGHTVRLLSRHAADKVKAWPAGVDAWPGDVGTPSTIEGAAEDCQAVLHLVGIVDESPPDATFERINVRGTEVVVNEATRAGCGRFVYVSSLGADRGASPYHRSKKKGEHIVQRFEREWVIVRPGAVYGPGDEHLSVLLRMIRALPVMPLIGSGDQRFQPIWHEDLAAGLAVSIDLPTVAGRILEVAGHEVITLRALVERMQALTDRHVPTVPVPEFLATIGLRTLDRAGLGTPVSESQLDMLREENVIPEGRPNALVQDLGVALMPLDQGLRRFVHEQPIQLPDAGVGTLQEKIFAVDVRPSQYDAQRLFAYLCDHLLDLVPSMVDTDPERSNPQRIKEGATLTMALPLRGHIQVRVAEAAAGRITFMTLEGHPLAGAIQFVTMPIEGGVHFEVRVYDRPANLVDWVLMRPIGDRMQDATWHQLASTVARVAGSDQPDVKHVVHNLDKQSAEGIEQWAKDLALRAQRREAAAQMSEVRESNA